MTVFRWIMGVIFGVLATGSLLSFVIFVSSGIDLWVGRARKLRQLAWAAALFWFNVEIWGRVVWTLIHWSR
jgi:hypothetical protein